MSMKKEDIILKNLSKLEDYVAKSIVLKEKKDFDYVIITLKFSHGNGQLAFDYFTK